MRKLRSTLVALMFLTTQILAVDFLRDFPDNQLLSQITAEKFKTHDAVIILKEQSYQINDKDVFYHGVTLRGKSIQKSNVRIIKLLTQAAIDRYGSFEFEYSEQYGNDFPNGFEVKVRILKEDKSIWVMPKDHVERIVSRRSSSGIPISRKVLFKIPNLSVGDVLQIEYHFSDVFSRSYSGIFFYNDHDYILFSNLYITLPFKEEVKFLSFPEDRIGQPGIKQISKTYGSGKTYFWSVRNLNAIPDEPFCQPFADQSLMTAFVVEKSRPSSRDRGDWKSLAKSYVKYYLDEDDIKDKKIKELGFSPKLVDSEANYALVDSLYTAIKKKIVLSKFNSLYPLSDDIKSVFETGKGDASDLSYVMYRILLKWKVKTKAVWIRDRRRGLFEDSVPSRLWFNRMGVMVTIANVKKVYDFDRSISSKYELPWHLNPVSVIAVDEDGFSNERINYFIPGERNKFTETHKLSLDDEFKINDSVLLNMTGSVAQKFRNKYYDFTDSEIKSKMEKDLLKSCLTEVDTFSVNDFLNEKQINLFFQGNSQVSVDQIESNLVISINNHYLQNFRDRIYATLRRNDIVFDSRFNLELNWDVDIPEGYSFNKNDLEDTVLNGPSQSTAKMVYKQNGSRVHITLNVKFPQMYIPITQFPDLIIFLDESLKSLGQNIIFSRNG